MAVQANNRTVIVGYAVAVCANENIPRPDGRFRTAIAVYVSNAAGFDLAVSEGVERARQLWPEALYSDHAATATPVRVADPFPPSTRPSPSGIVGPDGRPING